MPFTKLCLNILGPHSPSEINSKQRANVALCPWCMFPGNVVYLRNEDKLPAVACTGQY